MIRQPTSSARARIRAKSEMALIPDVVLMGAGGLIWRGLSDLL